MLLLRMRLCDIAATIPPLGTGGIDAPDDMRPNAKRPPPTDVGTGVG